MSATRPIVDALLAHLQAALPEYAVERYPDHPKSYRFIHPLGAVLVGYQGSRFARPDATDLVVQQRDLTLHLTLFGRGLHGDGAALDLLDRVRRAVTGFVPPDCTPCHLIAESFVDENAGAWQYSLTIQTETQQVQAIQAEHLPRFTRLYTRESSDPHHPDLPLKP